MAKAARLLLYVLLIWAPIPLASNRPLFWAVNGIAASLILLLFLAGELRGNARSDIDWRPAAWAGAAFVAVAVWMVIQTIPGVPAFLRHPVWGELAGAPDASGGAISINPSSTWTTIVQVLPAGLLAVVAMRLAVDRRRAAVLLNVILAATAGVAVYGLTAQVLGMRQLFLLESDAYPGFLTGTFVGRNAAATYFVVGIAIASSLIATRLERVLNERQGLKTNWTLLVVEVVRQSGVYLLADLILLAALFDTGSRGGTLAGAIALLTITLVTLRRSSGSRGTAVVAIAATLAAFVAVVGAAGDLLLARLQFDTTDEGRLLTYRDTLDMLLARPFLGHGAGTFIDAFPMYHLRAPNVAIWNKAHDTYLQLAAEIGIPAFLVFVAGVAVVLVTIVRKLGTREDPHPAGIAALSVAAATAFHSVVDFSLQIQAVGLTVAVILGAGLGEALAPRRRQRTREVAMEDPDVALGISQRATVNVTIPTAVRPKQGAAAPTG